MNIKTYKKNIGVLIGAYPKLFCKENPRPISKAAMETIFDDFPMDQKKLNYTMSIWTNRIEYVRAILANSHRYNLDGSVAEQITQNDFDMAELSLKKKDARYKELMFIRRTSLDDQTIYI